jgi:hypothetical protein
MQSTQYGKRDRVVPSKGYNFGMDLASFGGGDGKFWVLHFFGEETVVPLFHLGKGKTIVERRDGKITTVYHRDILQKGIDGLTVIIVAAASN